MSTPVHGAAEHNAENEPVKQDIIFNEVTDISGYDKNLKTARIYLYVIAALQVLAAAYEYFTLRDISEQYALIAVAVDISIGIVFVVLAVWSKKKPAAAFLTALIFYIAVQILAIIGDQSMIYKGIILKVLVIIALIKGFKDAKEYEQMKRTLGTGTSNI